MNGNPARPPSDPKNASAAAGSVPAKDAARPAAGDLDLDVEEIRLPERMKEGFVGQER